MGVFIIDATELHWLCKTGYEQEDLCLHGKVTAVIGEECVCDGGTVSATALYLLKSLNEDHRIDETLQMIPCCGDFFLPNEELTEVDIIGCPFGTDWSVEHIGEDIKITTASGCETIVSTEEYRREVFRFADMIEAYYKKSAKKKPNNDFENRGYIAFWNEWRRHRYG